MPKQGRRPEQRPAVGEKEVFQTAPSTWKSLVSNASAHKAIQLVFLCAVYSPISWLTLTPVYGGVPSALYHHQAKVAAILVGFLGRKLLRKLLPKNIARCLPGFAFSIPIIQLVLFRYSSFLGLPYGPLITQLLTYFPLVALSMYVAGECLEQVDLQGGSTTFLENGAVVFCYLVFTFFERFIRGFLIRRIGSNLIFSRVGLQMAVAMMYALVLPTAFWWPAPVSLAFTMTYNVHLPLQRTTDLLDSNLQPYNFSLIDRQESITGYLSVLENTEAHYRVLRCDHSLLGGEWTHFRQNVPGSRGRVQEPIYAIFTMLEAVRLVELPRGGSRRLDSESTALNIGLGTGTAASALIAHGVATTIVELDPTVHKFALKHFDFPTNHTPIIGDAVQFVKAAQRDGNKSKRYDYIIHDVFTGGAEPAELFTEEFLSGLRFLLKEDGVVAVNYAGDLLVPASKHVITTILSVFENHCRIFRETVPESSSNSSSPLPPAEDFTNLVIYCLNPATSASQNKNDDDDDDDDNEQPNFPQPQFHHPSHADLLNSGARQQFLYPRPELEVPLDDFVTFDHDNGSGSDIILRQGQTKEVEKWHRKSAIGHWRIMRIVLPAEVWENW